MAELLHWITLDCTGVLREVAGQCKAWILCGYLTVSVLLMCSQLNMLLSITQCSQREVQTDQILLFFLEYFLIGMPIGLVRNTREDSNGLMMYLLFTSFSINWDTVPEIPEKEVWKTYEKVVYKHRTRVRRQFGCYRLNVYWCGGMINNQGG